ncbi:RING finger protein 150-like isoform X1 [Tachypleus tridentatus]|uniref:RING finger protein 150-like isoform X1 n=2 Tax=Tachypleus tridentatus TaxID=6853 RepID=UPI003FD10241
MKITCYHFKMYGCYTCWFYFIPLLVFVDYFGFFGNCEFTYGYGPQEYAFALINITYTHPLTGKIYYDKSKIGKFNIGKIEPASGVVIHVSSNNHTTHDGCERFDSDIIPREPWIALIAHGHCKDTIKLQHAMVSNATAVVIYSSEYNSFGLKLQHQDGPSMKPSEMGYIRHLLHEMLYIPVFDMVSVLINKEDGEKIARIADNGTRVEMHITVGTPYTYHYANINRTSVLFVSISFIILMIISLAWLVFYYIQRFRYMHAKEILAKRLCNAAKKALDKIPVKTLKSGDLEAGGELECCAVCIEMFKVGEVVRTLPCKHTFHKSCVDPWLIDQRSCPMCKMDILEHYGLTFKGSCDNVLNMDEVDLTSLQHVEDLEVVHLPIHHQPVACQGQGEVGSPIHSTNLDVELALDNCSHFSPLQSPTLTVTSDHSPSLFHNNQVVKSDNGLSSSPK